MTELVGELPDGAVCSYSLDCAWEEVPATTMRIVLGKYAIPTCDKCADFYDRMKS